MPNQGGLATMARRKSVLTTWCVPAAENSGTVRAGWGIGEMIFGGRMVSEFLSGCHVVFFGTVGLHPSEAIL